MTLELLVATFQMSKEIIWIVCDIESDRILSEGGRIPFYLLEKNVVYATATPQEGGKYTEITCYIEL